jgi:hypothetical protein
MTPWAILLDSIPVFAMALAIVLVPLLADGRPRRRECRGLTFARSQSEQREAER